MMRGETDYIAVEPRKRAKYINAPIANPVVLRRMSSISEQWSENGSCDISMSSEKAVPASKVFGKLFKRFYIRPKRKNSVFVKGQSSYVSVHLMKREINHSAYNNNAYINHEKFKFTL